MLLKLNVPLKIFSNRWESIKKVKTTHQGKNKINSGPHLLKKTRNKRIIHSKASKTIINFSLNTKQIFFQREILLFLSKHQNLSALKKLNLLNKKLSLFLSILSWMSLISGLKNKFKKQHIKIGKSCKSIPILFGSPGGKALSESYKNMPKNMA